MIENNKSIFLCLRLFSDGFFDFSYLLDLIKIIKKIIKIISIFHLKMFKSEF